MAFRWTRRGLLSGAAAWPASGVFAQVSGRLGSVPRQDPMPEDDGLRPPPSAPPVPDVLTSVTDASDRMTVQVMINGRGPYAFLVDTGSERSGISAELATELGLPPGEAMMVHGVAGAQLTPAAVVGELKVGARRLQNANLPLFTHANIGAAGVLGIDAVQGQRVVLDFDRREIFVEATPARGGSFDEIVVTAKSRFGQLVLVDSSFDHQPILVVIDTGAQTTIGNLALKRHIRWQDAGLKSSKTDIYSVTGQTTTGDWAVISHVQVGGFSLNNLPVVFSELHSFERWRLEEQPALLLGMDVLRQFQTVQIDFGRREVRFRGGAQPVDERVKHSTSRLS